MSSHTSKLILALSCSVTIGIVSYVHMKQQADRGFEILQHAVQNHKTVINTKARVRGELGRQMQSRLEKMHEGVIKDIERQQRRKIENLYMLEKQNELTKQLKKELGS